MKTIRNVLVAILVCLMLSGETSSALKGADYIRSLTTRSQEDRVESGENAQAGEGDQASDGKEAGDDASGASISNTREGSSEAAIFENGANREKREKSVQKSFFEGVTFGNGIEPDVFHIYLGGELVVNVPTDWEQIEDEDAICAFTGTDEDNNRAYVAIHAMLTDGFTNDALEEQAKAQITYCTITTNGMKYYMTLTETALVTTWLNDEGTLVSVSAYLDSEGGLTSEKLISDLHQIMCTLRLVYDGELEQFELNQQ